MTYDMGRRRLVGCMRVGVIPDISSRPRTYAAWLWMVCLSCAVFFSPGIWAAAPEQETDIYKNLASRLIGAAT